MQILRKHMKSKTSKHQELNVIKIRERWLSEMSSTLFTKVSLRKYLVDGDVAKGFSGMTPTYQKILLINALRIFFTIL